MVCWATAHPHSGPMPFFYTVGVTTCVAVPSGATAHPATRAADHAHANLALYLPMSRQNLNYEGWRHGGEGERLPLREVTGTLALSLAGCLNRAPAGGEVRHIGLPQQEPSNANDGACAMCHPTNSPAAQSLQFRRHFYVVRHPGDLDN
eukprot:364011-Chlamydomonas_euryale.AAC.8